MLTVMCAVVLLQHCDMFYTLRFVANGPDVVSCIPERPENSITAETTASPNFC